MGSYKGGDKYNYDNKGDNEHKYDKNIEKRLLKLSIYYIKSCWEQLAASDSKCGILFPPRCDKACWRVNESV